MEARRRVRLWAVLAAVATMFAVFAFATRAEARGAEVTTGRFDTMPAGTDLGYDIGGAAVMLRVAGGDDGFTAVWVRVRGLDADETYPAHVHIGACADLLGHYQHDPTGPVDAVNEIWPTVSTNRRGIGRGIATHAHWARDEARSIVVHAPASSPTPGARIACADLD